MRQITFANQANFEKYGRKSRREQFLESMDGIIPWQELQEFIEHKLQEFIDPYNDLALRMRPPYAPGLRG